MFPVCAEAESSGDNGEPDGVAQNDGVVGVLPDLVLGLLLLGGSAVTDLLCGFLDLLLALLASGLGVGLDGLRLVVRGDRRDVRAVDVNERGDRLLRGLDLGDGRGATALLLVLGL